MVFAAKKIARLAAEAPLSGPLDPPRSSKSSKKTPSRPPAKVDVRTFVTHSDYLGGTDFWPSALDEMEAALASGRQGCILERGLGGGKSFWLAFMGLALLYRLAYDEACLGRDPRPRFGLAPGTVLYLLNVSNSAKNAKDIVFGTLLRVLQQSPWFREFLPHDPKVTSEIRFQGYSIIPRTSEITSVVGYNAFAALMDEANLFQDSTSRGDGTDYADVMFTELWSRVTSRFGRAGYVGVVSSRKTIRDFTARKRLEIEQSPEMSRLFYLPPPRSSWGFWPESRASRVRWRPFDTLALAWRGEPLSLPERGEDTPRILWVPEDHFAAFDTRPEEALRDLASLPSESLEPFLRRQDAIAPFFEMRSPIRKGVVPLDWLCADTTAALDGLVSPDFVADPDTVYHFHVDLGLKRDAVGIAVAHCSGKDEKILVENQKRPERAALVDVDFALQIKAPSGGEIEFERIRKILYWLRSHRGFRFGKSSFDGWQSIDSRQILKGRGFQVEEFSLDRTLLGYSTLKDVLYEGRLFFPPAYGQTPHSTATELASISDKGDPWAVLQVELRRLTLQNGKKVDHPKGGSKDVADAVAGAVTQVIRRVSAPQEELR